MRHRRGDTNYRDRHHVLMSTLVPIALQQEYYFAILYYVPIDGDNFTLSPTFVNFERATSECIMRSGFYHLHSRMSITKDRPVC